MFKGKKDSEDTEKLLKDTEKVLKDTETTLGLIEKSSKETCLALERAAKELAEQAKIQNEISALQRAISDAQSKNVQQPLQPLPKIDLVRSVTISDSKGDGVKRKKTLSTVDSIKRTTRKYSEPLHKLYDNDDEQAKKDFEELKKLKEEKTKSKENLSSPREHHARSASKDEKEAHKEKDTHKEKEAHKEKDTHKEKETHKEKDKDTHKEKEEKTLQKSPSRELKELKELKESKESKESKDHKEPKKKTKDESKEHKDDHKEKDNQKKEILKENSKEIPKSPKETPREMPKETPKETHKETPKETPKEIPKETAKETPNGSQLTEIEKAKKDLEELKKVGFSRKLTQEIIVSPEEVRRFEEKRKQTLEDLRKELEEGLDIKDEEYKESLEEEKNPDPNPNHPKGNDSKDINIKGNHFSPIDTKINQFNGTNNSTTNDTNTPPNTTTTSIFSTNKETHNVREHVEEEIILFAMS